MARYPVLSAAGQAVPASIFLKLREHLARFPGDVIPLQIGDTHLPPPAALHDMRWADIAPADLYAYGAPAGWGPLVDAIVERARTRNGLAIASPGRAGARSTPGGSAEWIASPGRAGARSTPGGSAEWIDASCVQITCGATHALSCAVQALCDRGEELILLTPHWPLIKGMSLGHGVVPVEVTYADEPGDLGAVIERAITPRTAAVYVASPNNPDGRMLSAADIDAIATVADRHDLWILSDEVYEHYGYDATHLSVAAHPKARSRTVTVFSFAKSYAQAGLRIGYALAPEPVTSAIKKLVNHSVYNVPVAMQRAALAAMQSGADFLAAARERYRAARDHARTRLTAPTDCPAGGAYLWVDFARWGNDCMPVLERCAERGVLLAPGSAFGDACTRHARLCFTGVDEARLEEGIDRINAVLAELS